MDWNAFIVAIKNLYPGCEGTNPYCRADIQYLVQDYQAKQMWNRDKLGEYTRAFQKILVLLSTNWKLAEVEHDMLYLNGFSSMLQQKIWKWLLITKQDIHLDNPYLMSDVITIAQFLLTGSAFRSSLPPAITAQPAFVAQPAFAPRQQQPAYAPPCPSPHVTPTNLAFNPVAGIKIEAMQVIHPPPLCKFCAAAGHFTHMYMCNMYGIPKRRKGDSGK